MKTVNKFTYTITAIFAVFVFIISSLWGGGVATVHAATSTIKFDETAVEDDLKDVSPADYLTLGLDGKPVLFSFMEYCYSDSYFKNDCYGLYIYIYNPARIEFSERNGANCVNMAVSYDEQGNPNDYKNVTLKYLSKTTGGNERLFYKFKLENSVDFWEIAKNYATAHDGVRRYDIAGLQLYTSGASSATDYGVSKTYKYTGYAEGYGGTGTTLTCEPLDTLTLEVHDTYFRTGEYKRNVSHDLTSVYFSVPDKYFENNFDLKKIKADWYEYETTPIVITSNTEVYNETKKLLGKNIGKVNNDVDISIYSDYQKLSNAAGHFASYGWVYNAWGGNAATDYIAPANTYCEQLDWLFTTNGSSVSQYVLSGERLKDYAIKYDKGERTLDIGSGRTVSVNLFKKELSETRANLAYVDNDIHHKQVDISGDDLFDMPNYNDSTPAALKFFQTIFGLKPDNVSESYYGLSPIHIVTTDDMQQPDIAKQLLIDGSDKAIKDFTDYYESETRKGNKVVLFRFAQTDYECIPVIAYNNRTSTNYSKSYGKDTYVVSESAFYNFDIIQLTFSDGTKLKIVPTVASPIDIFNDITLPAEKPDIWKLIIAVLAVIVLLFILKITGLLDLISKAVVWVVTLPFRAIGALFKRKN